MIHSMGDVAEVFFTATSGVSRMPDIAILRLLKSRLETLKVIKNILIFAFLSRQLPSVRL